MRRTPPQGWKDRAYERIPKDCWASRIHWHFGRLWDESRAQKLAPGETRPTWEQLHALAVATVRDENRGLPTLPLVQPPALHRPHPTMETLELPPLSA